MVTDSIGNRHAFRLPILQGMRNLEPEQILSEILAGITLATLAIPEVMGYTKIAGTPLVTGLYTILIPMILFAVFGSSRHLVVGADSATAAILAAGIGGLAVIESNGYLALSSLLALMAGTFLFLARIVRLGFLADFLSRTVLIGFLTGVGIQVAMGEVAPMLGLEVQAHNAWDTNWKILQRIDEWNGYAIGISVGVLIVIVSLKRISKKIPGALIGVIGAIIASWVFRLDQHVAVLGAIPSGFPSLGLPDVDWSWELLGKLIPTAFAMFVVILTQSTATSRAYAVRHNEQFSENTDLVGLAVANLGAGLSGTFVVNGSPTKTQMVDSAGGRSQLSQLVTATIVFFVLAFLTGALSYLPEAVLSAIVFLIGLDLIDLTGMRNIFRERRAEFWVALITAATVVIVGVEQGILLSIILSLIVHTRHGYHPKNAVLVPAASGVWHPLPIDRPTQVLPGLLIYRFTHGMYYANSQQLLREITHLANVAQPPLRWLCIDASAVDDIDYTAAATLRTLRETLNEKGVRLVAAQALPDFGEHTLHQLRELFGDEGCFNSVDDAVKQFRQQTSMGSS